MSRLNFTYPQRSDFLFISSFHCFALANRFRDLGITVIHDRIKDKLNLQHWNLNSAYDNTSLFCCIILGNIALLIAPKPENSVFGALGLAIKTLGLYNMLFTLRNCPGFCPQVFFNQLTETIVAYWALCQLVWHMVKELSMYRDVADKGEFISRVPRKTFTTVWPYLGELTIQI